MDDSALLSRGLVNSHSRMQLEHQVAEVLEHMPPDARCSSTRVNMWGRCRTPGCTLRAPSTNALVTRGMRTERAVGRGRYVVAVKGDAVADASSAIRVG